MGAEALLEVEHVGHVAPEDHVYHFESLPSELALAVVRVNTRVELDQLTREIVAGGTGVHETEVHADDLAYRSAVLADERAGRVERLYLGVPRVVNLTAARKLLTEQPVLPAGWLAGGGGR